MVGPGDEIAAPAVSRGHVRASDAARDQVIDTLKAAYVHGLVTKNEFDARVSQTFAARTLGELVPVTTDIPAGLATAPSALGPAQARGNGLLHASPRPGGRAIMATAILAGLALIAAIFAGPYAAAPELVGVGSALVSVVLLAATIRGQRRGHQLPRHGITSWQGVGPGPGRATPIPR